MDPRVAQMIARHDQDWMHAREWWRSHGEDVKSSVVTAIFWLVHHYDPALHIAGKMAALAFTDFLVEDETSDEDSD